MGFWFLLIVGMMAAGIGMSWLFAGRYTTSTTTFLFAILMILLAIVIKRDRKA